MSSLSRVLSSAAKTRFQAAIKVIVAVLRDWGRGEGPGVGRGWEKGMGVLVCVRVYVRERERECECVCVCVFLRARVRVLSRVCVYNYDVLYTRSPNTQNIFRVTRIT